MDVARPYAAVSPSLDGEVLRVLAGTTRGLTGREVAALAGRNSHSGVLGVLNRLTEHGLVERIEVGRALLFTLNRDHLAAPAVAILMGIRDEFVDRIRHEINTWKIEPSHLSLFGSTARGDGDTDSDIDLFVVRPKEVSEADPDWRAQLEELSHQIRRWTGNHAAIVEVAAAEVARLRREQPPIVAELRTDAITLSEAKIVDLVR